MKIVGLSFFALLGLFHISTFLDRSDKIFKGQTNAAEVGRLLVYRTPQFVFYVIPIAALLERARDLRPAVAQQRADGHESLRHQPVPGLAVGHRAVAGVQRR